VPCAESRRTRRNSAELRETAQRVIRASAPRSVLARAADRILHTTPVRGTPMVDAEAARFHASIPVVDLLVGSAIMRPDFVNRRRSGHVDLARLREGGVDLVGLSVATRLPDLRGTLSSPFFWSQGMGLRLLRSDLALAEALIDRVEGWEATSGGTFRIVRDARDLAAVGAGSHGVSAFLGVQGGHVLEGKVAALEQLRARGVRMFAPAHVMDNALVGSSTGVHRGGLSGHGREVIAECQRLGILVDLAHMSEAGIAEALPLLRPPFVLSHTGFTSLARAHSRWRRYSPGTRNLPDELARDVAAAGGVVGLTLSTWLLGGTGLDAVGRAVDRALELCGPGRVAIGSDMDGGLRTVVDAAGFPRITAELLARGHSRDIVAAVMGGNALQVLRGGPP
jgi:membrane dipeptidase